jgi:aerobic carbon-monoxide dehydrogenase medium subunit
MKPAAFEYRAPDTLEGCLDVLAEVGDDAAVIAGGQSLVPLLNMRLARPLVVVDPRKVAALRARPSPNHLGALVTAAELEDDPVVGPAVRHIGHPQIRNRTTVGGSLAHADPAAELPAALVALEGSVVLRSRDGGERTVAAAEFFDGPFQTVRRPDELLTAVDLGPLAAAGPGAVATGLRTTVVEVARRPGDFALVGAFVARTADGRCRIALFGVDGRPVRAGAAEAAVVGGARPAEAAALVGAELHPGSDVHASAAYRRHVAGVVVERALEALA